MCANIKLQMTDDSFYFEGSRAYFLIQKKFI